MQENYMCTWYNFNLHETYKWYGPFINYNKQDTMKTLDQKIITFPHPTFLYQSILSHDPRVKHLHHLEQT